jgi:Protein of unknown function (DUF1572)
MSFESDWLNDVRVQFEKTKAQVEGALAQVRDDELNRPIDSEANSIAVIMKHMAGNLRSRFTDFLTTDGEKPDRNRDGEFEVDGPVTREQVMADWNRGWAVLFATLETLTPADLGRDVSIRGERHSIIQAMHRQMTHHAHHAGQILLLAKHFRGEEWKTLSMPKRKR